jgi:hypothetical protein
MKIRLKDIPLPHLSDGTIIIYLNNKSIANKILVKCEELGWLWAGEIKPTKFSFDWDSGRFYLELGGVNGRNDRLFCTVRDKILISSVYILVDDQDNSSLKIDLKAKNTSSSATHCISCGSKLKDPGMGPLYKHCPKCEP